MSAAVLTSRLLDYDLGGGRIADDRTSETLRSLQAAMRAHARAPASDLRSATRNMLADILEQCASDEWDGEGSCGVSERTAGMSERLVLLLEPWLPTGTPLPDIVPEPDGDLSFTWQSGPARLFSISVSGRGELAFASKLAGGSEFHGKAQLDGIPEGMVRTLAEGIRSLFRRDPGSSSR